MPTASKVKKIVIHCTAGFGSIESIQSFWKSLGWKGKGYHVIIGLENTYYLTKDSTYTENPQDVDFTKITNGVLGWNEECIHIAYIGGVEKIGTKWKGKDTRTDYQKAGIVNGIVQVYKWLAREGIDLENTKIDILGHRDFSPDKNGNGVIESWERIKECPSFDAIPEYQWITISQKHGKTKLPKK